MCNRPPGPRDAAVPCNMRRRYNCAVALGILGKPAKVNRMAAGATGQLIRSEIGADGVCILTFDRPESGANIFDAATMDNLREHVDAIEKDASIKGVIVTSAKKSIFIAG